MCDVIKEWLVERLGVMMDIQSHTFLSVVQNGYLIAELLNNFGAITQEQFALVKSSKSCEDVLDKIQIWLHTVGVDFDDETKHNIIKGKLSSCIKLIYKMYLVLKSKDLQSFAAKEVANKCLRPSNERFEITQLIENVSDPSIVAPHPLSQPLADHKHIIQWHNDRYEALLERCKQAKEAYLAHVYKFEEKPKIKQFKTIDGIDQFSYAYSKPDDYIDAQSMTYDQLREEQIRAQNLEEQPLDANVVQSIVNRIKRKNRKKAEDTAFATQTEHVMRLTLWDCVFQDFNQEKEIDISKKMLKQSMFEKQLTAKLFEIREQKSIIMENRQGIDKEIQNKRDEELLEQIFFNVVENTDERYRYYFERDRALQLHRKIYNERLRLKDQRNYETCEQMVKDIVDISLSHSEYKEAFGEDLPKYMATDLAALFVSEQPIFELVPETEDIIVFEPENEQEEDILCDEISRQNAIDMINFDAYCNFDWPWEIDENDPECQLAMTEIKAAMNIFGHIVFRLLLTKYPKPEPAAPPNIPTVDVAVCINCIKDPTVLPVLQKLLSSRNIKVIEMEDAINYCVEAYKDETSVDYPESQFIEETEEALEAVKKSKKDQKKKKDVKAKTQTKNSKVKDIKKKDMEIDSALVVPLLRDEQNQTPRIFPCEEPVLSSEAEFGRLAYEILNLGDPLNDKLLVNMFLEYLKTLTDIQGWVLVNYPKDFEQVILLEEALTSKRIPRLGNEDEYRERVIKVITEEDLMMLHNTEPTLISTDTGGTSTISTPKSYSDSIQSGIKNNLDVNEIADIDFRYVKQNHSVYDPNADFRTSKILVNPDPLPPEDDYDTYLTAYIGVIESPTEENEDVAKPYYVEEDLELSDAEIFYRNQGCSYSLYYKVFDLPTIKHLAKLIIGDYSLPPKTSLQLFGNTLTYLETDFNQSEEEPGKESKSKTKGGKKEKKEKKEKQKTPSIKKDEGGQGDAKKKDKKDKEEKKGGKDNKKKEKGKKKDIVIPEEVDVIILREDKETQIPEILPEIEEPLTEPPPEPKPGEYNWKYFDLMIPQELQIALASLWENTEGVYVHDFRELFFRRRLLWKSVMPYMTFVKKMMKDFITRPDYKQIHLYQFQIVFNELDDDIRGDAEVKEELHCRVHEFREKMWQICDERKQEAEARRIEVVQQDWVTKQLCELTNIYIAGMQLEVDRSSDSLHMLNDYYTAQITKMPSEDQVFQKPLLENVKFNGEVESEPAFIYSKYVQDVLSDPKGEFLNSPFCGALGNGYDLALSSTAQYHQICCGILAKMEGYFQPKGKKGKQKKEKGKSKGKGKLDRTLPKFSEPEPEVTEAGLSLIQEWARAIEGEILRVQLRLKMINSVAQSDLQSIFRCGSDTFHGLFSEIAERHEREMSSVNEACEVIGKTIEEEVKLQPQLILDGDRFYIDQNVLLFEEPLPEPDKPIKDYQRSEVFTMEQLLHLVNVLKDIAPTGAMPERAFTYLLEDMIVQDAEDGKPPMVPPLWQKVSSKQMNDLTFAFFGNVELVDWKDFVIYNLCIDFPTEEELMETRKQFRESDPDCNEFVYSYQFNTVTFWFEKNFDKNDSHEVYRLNKIKEILYIIYSINVDTVNYTSLLLTFCKDKNYILGVSKALELSLGKFVCWQDDIGKAFVESVRKRKYDEEQERLQLFMIEQEKLETAEEIVDDLIDKTVHVCDSCYLEDYVPEEELELFKDNALEEEVAYLEGLIGEEYEGNCDEEGYEAKFDPLSSNTEEENSGAFLQESFSNVDIGFEENLNPSKVYYLTHDIILTVFMTAVPCYATVQTIGSKQSFRQKLDDCFEACKNPEFNNMVLTHEFLNSELFNELMKENFKFVARNPVEIINKLIADI